MLYKCLVFKKLLLYHAINYTQFNIVFYINEAKFHCMGACKIALKLAAHDQFFKSIV